MYSSKHLNQVGQRDEWQLRHAACNGSKPAFMIHYMTSDKIELVPNNIIIFNYCVENIC